LKCSGCGTELKAGKRFCTGCGRPVPAHASVPGNPRGIPQKKDAGPGKLQKASPGAPGTAEPGVRGRQIQSPETSNTTRRPGGGIGIPSPKILLPVLAFVIAAACISYFLFKRPSSPDITEPVFPPAGTIVLEEIVEDTPDNTRIVLYLEAGNAVQSKELTSILQSAFNHLKSRSGFKYHKSATQIAVYIYASAQVYEKDSDWWLGHLGWTEGTQPETELNLDALLPRQGNPAYEDEACVEYALLAEDTGQQITAGMRTMDRIYRDYEKLRIEEEVFLRRGRKAAENLVEITSDLPVVPYDGSCSSLEDSFLGLVESTYYFQDIFNPDYGLFDDNRLDMKEYLNELNGYLVREKEFREALKGFKE